MTAYRGCNGLVEVGPTPIPLGELKAWTNDAAASEIDSSVMGDCTSSSVAGPKKTTGTVEVNYDPDDAGQDLLIIGDKIQLIIYPTGKTVGKSYTAAAALILTVNIGGTVDGLISSSFSYSIDGEFAVVDL